jgi:hypothetical protein
MGLLLHFPENFMSSTMISNVPITLANGIDKAVIKPFRRTTYALINPLQWYVVVEDSEIGYEPFSEHKTRDDAKVDVVGSSSRQQRYFQRHDREGSASCKVPPCFLRNAAFHEGSFRVLLTSRPSSANTGLGFPL